MRIRLRIRSWLVIIALAAIPMTIAASTRDRRELVRIDRGIKGLNSSIWYCRWVRIDPDPPPGSAFYPGSRWEALAPIPNDGPPIKTWTDERAIIDREISRLQALLRTLERRRDQIRKRWFWLL